MLPRIVGASRAREMLFTARRLSGDEALGCGLVGHLVDDAALQDRALELARAAQAIPAEVLGAMKRVLNGSADLPWARAREMEVAQATGAVEWAISPP